MANKPISQIKDDLLRYLAFIEDSIDRELADQIGAVVVAAMLNFIEKGISPIDDNGRFPGYKWVELRNALRKEKQLIAKLLRNNRGTIRASKAGFTKFAGRVNSRQAAHNRKRLQARQKLNKSDLASILASKYPFSAQKKYPGKKPRPVNLFLSGDFLSKLKAVVAGAGKGVGVEIGFFDDLSAKKEQGHREGANTQPLRPIIPIDTEDFAISIQNAIWDLIEARIDKAAESGPSS